MRKERKTGWGDRKISKSSIDSSPMYPFHLTILLSFSFISTQFRTHSPVHFRSFSLTLIWKLAAIWTQKAKEKWEKG